MKIAYKYRIYPDKEQQIMLLNKMRSVNTLWNISVDWYKAYLIQRWLDENKPMYESKSGKKLYPNFKGLSTLAIQKEIYHLKDDVNIPAWSLIQYKKFKENKEKYMEYLKNCPSSAIYYICQSLSMCFKQNYNLKILERRKEQLKRKLKRNEELIKQGKQPKKIHFPKYWYNDVEYDDNFHINIHNFSINDCSMTLQQKNQAAIVKEDNGKVFFKIPSIGKVKMIYHRDIPAGSKFDAITISKKGKYWYLALGGLDIKEQSLMDKNEVINAIGIDKNADNHMYDSTGHQIKNPIKLLKKLEKRIARLKRHDGCIENPKFNDRTTGSRRYKRAHLQMANLYHKIQNIKMNMLHNETTRITDDYGLICLEDQCNVGMSRYNGRYTHKVNYTAFDNQIEYKAKLKGRHVVKVDRFFPSTQLCCKCGKKHPELKDMNKRVMRCECGNIIHRDYNAAINIRNEGVKNFFTIKDENNFEKITKKFLTNENMYYIKWVK